MNRVSKGRIPTLTRSFARDSLTGQGYQEVYIMISDKTAFGAKPKEKSYMIRDENGLYLRITPTGKKYWIIRYWTNGKESQKSIGPYPLISLKAAREARNEFKLERRNGGTMGKKISFQAICEDWQCVKGAELAENTQKTVRLRLSKYILPYIGRMNAEDINAATVLSIIRPIEESGKIETAKRIRVIIGQIIRYGIACGLLKEDPTQAIRGALRSGTRRHYSAPQTEDDMREIIQTIKGYPYTITKNLLLLQAYTATRPGEVRRAEWKEINGDEWRIPAERMKARRPHSIPLTKQAQEVLREMREITGKGKFIFPSLKNSGQPISDNGARVALRRMGIEKEKICPHGFRAAFSTIANANGKNADVIEAVLAHTPQNQVRAAYNRASYTREKRELLEWYCERIAPSFSQEGPPAQTL